MPDLAQTLEGMFTGGDVSIVQAKAVLVAQGVATVEINGGTFTDVPYLTANYGGGQTYPSNSQTVYVIARRNWGMLIIGSPAPGPPRSISSGSTVLWLPTVLASYFPSSSGWSVSSDDQLPVDSGSQAVEIYNVSNRPPLPGTGMSGAGFAINLLSAESGGFLGGGAYLNVGLHANATPAGPLAPVAGTTEQVVFLNVNDPQYLPIPLDWASRLVAGTAKGIYVRASGDFDINQITLGALQLAFL